MAIKAGQILHAANGFVIDRIQTGGVSNLNIPQEKIYELGNYLAVAQVRDIPEVTFDVERRNLSTVQSRLMTLGTVSIPVVGTRLTQATIFVLALFFARKHGLFARRFANQA